MTTTNVSLIAAVLLALAPIAGPARAADPQITFTISKNSAQLPLKILDAARKVCAASAELPDAEEFGSQEECVEAAVSSTQFAPAPAAKFAGSARGQG